MDAVIEERIIKMALETYDAAIMLYPTRYPPASAWAVSRDGGAVRKAWEESLPMGKVQGLYLNIPFCREICRFCYLPVVKPSRAGSVDRYLDALEREAEAMSPLFAGRTFSAFYAGGGTPSLLTVPQIRRVFSIAKRCFDIRIEAPFRMAFESNPESLTEEKLRVLAEEGVDWLSMGIQSLDAGVLRAQRRASMDATALGRIFEAARAVGIGGIGVDMMCGLEGQTLESFVRDVKAVAALRPDQVFLNTFRPLPTTQFAREGRALRAAEIERCRTMWKAGFEAASGQGYLIIGNYLLYNGTSVSAIGLTPVSANLLGLCPFFRSASVLGLGAGAISYAYRTRWQQNTSDPDEYGRRVSLGRLPVERTCATGPLREMINFIVERLELEGRVPREEFARAFGCPVESEFAVPLAEAVRDGWLREDPDFYRLTRDYGETVFRIAQAFFETDVLLRMAARRDAFLVGEDREKP